MARLQRELEVATELARRAGADALRIQKGGVLDVELKAGEEPVTIADHRASEIIVAGLRAAFPDDPLISEELPPAPGALGSQRLWLIDPIDGTKDFIQGDDGYSIMIGLVEAGRPVVGVVHIPGQDRTYWASPAGAFMSVGDKVTPLRVSDVHDVEKIRLVASKSHRMDDLDRVKLELKISDELNVASVGAKLGLIAVGVRDLYINPASKTKSWDTCAPEAILVAAGGRLTDVFGGPIEYDKELKHRRGLLASNGHVHDEVVQRVSPLLQHLAQ
ncbi:MAG TPA: 3'(2'),5'-bisphosphate nucleotidase CysQ [Kofleriaceae bacterium]|nr:3'(2'),5'-bisphosphate nucleotidase CysQ [Kofleriaceae bacterium]